MITLIDAELMRWRPDDATLYFEVTIAFTPLISFHATIDSFHVDLASPSFTLIDRIFRRHLYADISISFPQLEIADIHHFHDATTRLRHICHAASLIYEIVELCAIWHFTFFFYYEVTTTFQ